MSGFINLGPKTPLGSPFEVSLLPDNAGINILGSIPIIGIWFGLKRIAAISEYSTIFGPHTGINRVIIKDLGSGNYHTQSITSYTRGHYFRGIAEISGLGVVLTILEFIASVLQLIILIALLLTAILTLIVVIPFTFVCSAVLARKQIINKYRFQDMSESKYEKKIKEENAKKNRIGWHEEPVNLISIFNNILFSS
ncbi:hypothetical protein C834K_0529 [Chlamydia poikilotherma]|uniref:Uncharacterized protein n=1 Tax=Chlamydia poikilotherma TaxID=1967783 RepID=A0A3B0Q7Q7_9CHLA|nr:hypothetical protein [Chlamydia poikilotherma]SYX08987.1 hypothetical protein C834K_0529 [Chlamydia poikilotherma]